METGTVATGLVTLPMIEAYNFDHEKYIDQRNDISPLFDAAEANDDIQ